MIDAPPPIDPNQPPVDADRPAPAVYTVSQEEQNEINSWNLTEDPAETTVTVASDKAIEPEEQTDDTEPGPDKDPDPNGPDDEADNPNSLKEEVESGEVRMSPAPPQPAEGEVGDNDPPEINGSDPEDQSVEQEDEPGPIRVTAGSGEQNDAYKEYLYEKPEMTVLESTTGPNGEVLNAVEIKMKIAANAPAGTIIGLNGVLLPEEFTSGVYTFTVVASNNFSNRVGTDFNVRLSDSSPEGGVQFGVDNIEQSGSLDGEAGMNTTHITADDEFTIGVPEDGSAPDPQWLSSVMFEVVAGEDRTPSGEHGDGVSADLVVTIQQVNVDAPPEDTPDDTPDEEKPPEEDTSKGPEKDPEESPPPTGDTSKPPELALTGPERVKDLTLSAAALIMAGFAALRASKTKEESLNYAKVPSISKRLLAEYDAIQVEASDISL